MNWIRIGKRYINLDLVCEVVNAEEVVYITFAATSETDEMGRVLHGREADDFMTAFNYVVQPFGAEAYAVDLDNVPTYPEVSNQPIDPDIPF